MARRPTHSSALAIIALIVGHSRDINAAWPQEVLSAAAQAEAQFYARNSNRINRLLRMPHTPKVDVVRDRFTLARMHGNWEQAELELENWDRVLQDETHRMVRIEEFIAIHQEQLDFINTVQGHSEVDDLRRRIANSLAADDYNAARQWLEKAKRQADKTVEAERAFRRNHKNLIAALDDWPFGRSAEKARNDYRQAMESYDFVKAEKALRTLDDIRKESRRKKNELEEAANTFVATSNSIVLADSRIEELKAQLFAKVEAEDWATAYELVSRMSERRRNLHELNRHE